MVWRRAPPYLANKLKRVSALDSRRRLRSAATDTVVVPPIPLSAVGDTAFTFAAARAWKSLPTTVATAPNIQFDAAYLALSLCFRCPGSYS